MTTPPILNLYVSESNGNALTVVPSTVFTSSIQIANQSPSFSLSVSEVPYYSSTAGTASFATSALSASFAATTSLAINAISASYATTSSYALASAGTITNAISASYSVSSSYAQVFPYVGDAQITGSLAVTKEVAAKQFSINSNNGLFVLTGSVSTGILGVTENINPTISTASFSGVVLEYLAQRPSGIRIGMVMGAWSGSTYTFTDVSSTDIGDTSDLLTGFLLINDKITFQVNSAGSGSGTWTVQTLFKLFPKLS